VDAGTALGAGGQPGRAPAELWIALAGPLGSLAPDGGHILRAVVWERTRNPGRSAQPAANVGVFIAWLMILGGLWQALTADSIDGL
jgi:Zn-dependent protease